MSLKIIFKIKVHLKYLFTSANKQLRFSYVLNKSISFLLSALWVMTASYCKNYATQAAMNTHMKPAKILPSCKQSITLRQHIRKVLIIVISLSGGCSLHTLVSPTEFHIIFANCQWVKGPMEEQVTEEGKKCKERERENEIWVVLWLPTIQQKYVGSAEEKHHIWEQYIINKQSFVWKNVSRQIPTISPKTHVSCDW